MYKISKSKFNIWLLQNLCAYNRFRASGFGKPRSIIKMVIVPIKTQNTLNLISMVLCPCSLHYPSINASSALGFPKKLNTDRTLLRRFRWWSFSWSHQSKTIASSWTIFTRHETACDELLLLFKSQKNKKRTKKPLNFTRHRFISW